MKLILICLLYITVHCKKLDPIVLREWENAVAPHLDECVKISNVDWDIANNMFRHVHLPDEGTFHCYMKCIFDKLLYLNEKELDEQQMLKGIYALTPDLSKMCLGESQGIGDICEKVYNITKCIVHDIAD